MAQRTGKNLAVPLISKIYRFLRELALFSIHSLIVLAAARGHLLVLLRFLFSYNEDQQEPDLCPTTEFKIGRGGVRVLADLHYKRTKILITAEGGLGPPPIKQGREC